MEIEKKNLLIRNEREQIKNWKRKRERAIARGSRKKKRKTGNWAVRGPVNAYEQTTWICCGWSWYEGEVREVISRGVTPGPLIILNRKPLQDQDVLLSASSCHFLLRNHGFSPPPFITNLFWFSYGFSTRRMPTTMGTTSVRSLQSSLFARRS